MCGIAAPPACARPPNLARQARRCADAAPAVTPGEAGAADVRNAALPGACTPARTWRYCRADVRSCGLARFMHASKAGRDGAAPAGDRAAHERPLRQRPKRPATQMGGRDTASANAPGINGVRRLGMRNDNAVAMMAPDRRADDQGRPRLHRRMDNSRGRPGRPAPSTRQTALFAPAMHVRTQESAPPLMPPTPASAPSATEKQAKPAPDRRECAEVE